MDILDRDDHLAMCVEVAPGVHCWLEAWADEPGRIHLLIFNGLIIQEPSPGYEEFLEELESFVDAINQLGAAAEIIFDAWREDLTLVVKNSQLEAPGEKP